MSYTLTHDEIDQYVGSAFSVTWASRDQLLREAFNNNAPHEVVDELVALPEMYFRDVNEVCARLPHVAAS